MVATGFRNKFDVVPGLGPDGYAQTITTLADAERAGIAWRKFLDDPGPVVIGATQGASCFGAAYEFLFNTSHQLRKAKLDKQGVADLRHLRAVRRPLRHRRPAGRGEAAEDVPEEGGHHRAHRGRVRRGHRRPDQAHRRHRRAVPVRHGGAAVRGPGRRPRHPGLSDDKGYIPVEDTYQSKAYPEIYAAGIAAQVPVPWQTSVPIGIPKTGFPTESMAKVAARNIAAAIKGEPPVKHKDFGEMAAVCMMDAGNNGVMILADHMLPPRKAAMMIPGPQVHAMKVGFEKYYLWKSRHGYVRLP